MPLIGLVRLRRARGLRCPYRPNPAKSSQTGLGDHETAAGRKCPADLVTVKAGKSPACGRLERVGRMPHTRAAEGAVMHQGCKEKSGALGT